MKNKLQLIAVILLLSNLNHQLSIARAQGTAFTYQGRLNDGGSPAHGIYDFRFKLFQDSFGNTQAGGTILLSGISVTNGLFAATIDFGAGIFNGSNYWLEVDVRTNGGGGYANLNPLQAVTPAPYAIFANTASNVSGTISSANLSGAYNSVVMFNNGGNNFIGSFTGNGANVTNVSAVTLGGLGAGQFWKITGNSNTVAGANFLGTADNQPLELSANGQRALRLEPNANGAPNVIGGATNNFVDAGVIGATIAGGGAANYSDNVAFFNASNHVSASFGTISGGRANIVDAGYGVIGGGGGNVIQSNATYSAVVGGIYNKIQAGAFQSAIGGGYLNLIRSNAALATIGGGTFNIVETNAPYATIGGGSGNTINTNAYAATIGGGEYNLSYGYDGTVGGGYGNASRGDRAVVGGGINNSAVAYAATVPGGYQNVAAGQYSFAAGQNARASHDGSFVWSDESSFTTFVSTGLNEFDVRAYGGVHFVTGGAGLTLDGQAVVPANALTNLNAASIASGTLADARLSTNVALRAGGNAFTGQQTITGGDASQLVLQNSADSRSWYIYDENFNGSGALVFLPSGGPGNVGAYIRRSDGNYVVNSDARLKQDINPLGGVLDRVLQLRPVSYHFRSAPEGTPLTLGLIAQEVEPLFPEVVSEHDGIKSMAYSELIPVTLRAVQELNQKLEEQRTELKQKEMKVTELEQRLAALERIVLGQKSN